MSEKKEEGAVFELEDQFQFQCGKNVSCFNECCRDVTIFLGPYDVLRLRQGLDITAKEFIEKYTSIVGTERLIPMIVLRMNEDDEKRCHFVTKEGCSVYRYRPWACRMFPLDVTEEGKSFKTVIDTIKCKGLNEELTRPVLEYLNEQGTPKYQVMDDLMGELINDERFRAIDVDNEQIQQMIFMALYDLDAFRKFIFESSFLEKFEIEDRRVKRLKRDDDELLRLGYEWIAFGLLGKRSLQLKQELLDKAKKEGDQT